MDAKEYFIDIRKICKGHDHCDSCELYGKCIVGQTWYGSDSEYESMIDESIKIVKKLCHLKTYADDVFEKFPCVMKDENETPMLCRKRVYEIKHPHYCGEECSCKRCWNEHFPEEDVMK